jgi:hypothetical protein
MFLVIKDFLYKLQILHSYIFFLIHDLSRNRECNYIYNFWYDFIA